MRVWDAGTHKCLATLVGHTGAVRALAATDSLVFSGSDDATIRVRGVHLQTPARLPTMSPPLDPAVSPPLRLPLPAPWPCPYARGCIERIV